MLGELGINDIPFLKGAPSLDCRKSQASEFLADTARNYPGEVTILATGSLSNLYGAYLHDNSFYKNLKQIVLMGGITQPLLINGKKLDELNFSCDPEASFSVLSSGTPVTVLTGQICLQGLFGQKLTICLYSVL